MFWPFTVWGFLKPNFKLHEYWLSRTCCCNSTYRLRYWNRRLKTKRSLTSSCNSTYRLRYWNLTLNWWLCIVAEVATVLTACGIETPSFQTGTIVKRCNSTYRLRYWNAIPVDTLDGSAGMLQQYLPLAVLKQTFSHPLVRSSKCVATVLTACGIETSH